MFAETEGLLGEKPKIVIEIEDKENEPIVISNDRGYESRRERNNSDNKSKSDKKKRLSKDSEKVKGVVIARFPNFFNIYLFYFK